MLSVRPHMLGHYVTVTAEGGNRRERGARIGAAMRGKGMVIVGRRYSETYGFQTQTEAVYRPV